MLNTKFICFLWCLCLVSSAMAYLPPNPEAKFKTLSVLTSKQSNPHVRRKVHKSKQALIRHSSKESLYKQADTFDGKSHCANHISLKECINEFVCIMSDNGLCIVNPRLCNDKNGTLNNNAECVFTKSLDRRTQ